jgi:hypothetical protein
MVDQTWHDFGWGVHRSVVNRTPIWLRSVVYLNWDGVLPLVQQFVELGKVIFANGRHKIFMYFLRLFPVILPYWRFTDWVVLPFFSLNIEWVFIEWEKIVDVWRFSGLRGFFYEQFHGFLLSGVDDNAVISVYDKVFSVFKRVVGELLFKVVFVDVFEDLIGIEADDSLLWFSGRGIW